MHFYNGPVPGDERPIGGGRYNKNKIGHEVYNFRETDGRLYGYFQPTMSSQKVALERIDPTADKIGKLNRVLLVFVARGQKAGKSWLAGTGTQRFFGRGPNRHLASREVTDTSVQRDAATAFFCLTRIGPSKSPSAKAAWGNRMFAIR
jgi:hypothetical protein